MAMNRIALYHLETLLWIAKLGTFGAAAERLNTTQPAISARVRELETHLGTRLFRREGRIMSLTPVGRQLVREYAPIWGQLQSTLLNCGGVAEATGVIRIGAGEIAAVSCLPGFVAALKNDLPNVSLEIDIDLTANLIQQLLSGRTDIAFTAGPVAQPALKAASIGSVDLLWLASPAIAASLDQPTQGEAVSVWSLAGHSPLYQMMSDAISAAGLRYRSLNLCNNVRSMIDIVAAGGGIGIFPRPMVQQHIASGSLVRIANSQDPPPIEFHVLMRTAEYDPLVLEIFHRSSLLAIAG